MRGVKMEAKDTVMKDPANLEWTEEPTDKYAADFSFVEDYKFEVKRLLETQADISFKAGKEEKASEYLTQITHLGHVHREITQKLVTEAKQTGIKEAAEWIENNCTGDSGDGYLRQEFNAYAWQAFLKEKGL